MRYNFLVVIVFLLISSCLGCSESPVKITPNPDENKGFQTNETLDKTWLQVQANPTGIQSRAISEFLLEAAGNNWPQDRLRTTLRNLASLQIRDRSNPYYGNFLWSKGDKLPSSNSSFDINGVIFCTSPMAILRLKYYDNLNEDNKALLDEIIDLAMPAILRDVDDRRASYTNTWMMRTWSLCGMGEALGDKDLLEEGRSSLKEWMRNIYNYGIIEYNSGVYTPISIANLGCIANMIQDTEIKKEATIALRYFSRTLYANLFSYDNRGATMSGPQSRNYNFVHSRGGNDIICRILNQTEQNFFNKHAAWNPTLEDLNLYRKRPRHMVYRNGTSDDHYVVNYVGSQVNMGSAGTTYSSEDKTFVINFSDENRSAVVHISSVFDGRSDPYGERLVGGTKPRHLRYYLTARAQRMITSGSEMVFLISGDGYERDDTEILNHYVILPADRQDGLWNGNSPINNLGVGEKKALSSEDNSTLFVRFGNAVAGLRYLKVLDTNGEEVNSIHLVNTPNKPQSISAGTAMYLQSQLSTSRPAKGEQGMVAMWWKVKENISTEAEFKAFRDEMIQTEVSFVQNGDEVTVKVKAPDGDLGVSGNRKTQLQTATYGGLTLPANTNFVIDGSDVAPVIFKESTYIQ